MKKMMLTDLWTMMIAWCFFLNGYGFLAFLLVLSFDMILLFFQGEVNYWRVSALTIGLYTLTCGMLFCSNIPYYFPNLHIFLSAAVLNGALLSEYCYSYKRGLPLLLTGVMTLFMLILGLLIYMAPFEDYTLFSKNSLYLMDMFIFLPHMFPCLVCAVHKSLVRNKRNIILNKKAAQ